MSEIYKSRMATTDGREFTVSNQVREGQEPWYSVTDELTSAEKEELIVYLRDPSKRQPAWLD